MVSPIGETIAGCLIKEQIGAGGMGDVFLAREEFTQRDVALKLIRGPFASDPTWRDQFVLEARTAANVQHPNVVTIYAAGELEGGGLFLRMEYVRGGSARDRMTNGPPFTAVEVAGVGLAVARALAASWARGIVHLDIKPDNILCYEHTDGQVDWKVADFGLARQVVSGEDPREGKGSAGTPIFMAREQWDQEEVDGRTDLYALGRTLYTLLSGKHPYVIDRTASPFAWYLALGEGPGIPLAEQVPEAPSALVELIQWMIEIDKENRPASAAEVVQGLRRCLRDMGSETEAAYAPPLTHRLGSQASVREETSAAPPFAGRVVELARIRDAFDALAGSGGRAIVVTGARGVGRTRFLDEVAASCFASGIPVYEKDLELAERIGDQRGIGVVGNSVGELLEASDADRADLAFLKAQAAARRTGNAFDEALSAFYYGRFLSRTRGRHRTGAAEFERSISLLERLGNTLHVEQARAALADAREKLP